MNQSRTGEPALDELSIVCPTIAIVARGRPAWAAMPPGLTLFDTMPLAEG
jgi:hypothetical protein